MKLIGYLFLAAYYAILLLLCRSVWQSAKSRRWVKASVVAVPLLCLIHFPGMYFGLLPWATLYNDIIWTYRITGRPFSLGNAEQSYHSRREFNGDGYSIDVYRLSEGVAKHFETPPPEFFEKRPERSDVRSHWEAVTWRKTPSRPEDMDYIHFVSIYPGEAGRHDKKGQDVAASLLSEAGNYYAYFHHGDIGDVDLFILSPRRRLFVIVNLNT